MLITFSGLSKGTLHFSGIGPEHVWTLTDRSGKIIDLWKIFAYTLPQMEHAHLCVGREHFIFRGSACYETPELLDALAIDHYLKTGEIKQEKLRVLLSWITTISKDLCGKEVRVHVYLHEFTLLGKDYHEELKSRNLEKTKGLYVNKNAFAHITHHRKDCRIKKSDQCIFAKHIKEVDHTDTTRSRYICIRPNSAQREKILSLKEDRKMNGLANHCNDIRGFEIF